MRNHTNPNVLGAEKRFEILVKKEMNEFQHLISSYNKEMQEMRESLKLAMERFDSLYEKNEVELKNLTLHLNQEVLFLREKVLANERQIADQKLTIDSLHKELTEFQETHVSKKDLDKVKDEFYLSINENTNSHINSFQELQRELKDLIKSISNDFLMFRYDVVFMKDELNDKIDKKNYMCELDKDGFMKKFTLYEKNLFVIEKKIENIYTLIERINKKRGESSCHKPE